MAKCGFIACAAITFIIALFFFGSVIFTFVASDLLPNTIDDHNCNITNVTTSTDCMHVYGVIVGNDRNFNAQFIGNGTDGCTFDYPNQDVIEHYDKKEPITCYTDSNHKNSLFLVHPKKTGKRWAWAAFLGTELVVAILAIICALSVITCLVCWCE